MQPEDHTIDLVLTLIDRAPTRQPILVAVDGLGGAGKSTLADQVAAQRPDVVVIHGDDFYGPEERDWRDWSPEQGFERYFEHMRLAREVLVPLRAGRPASFQRYDWAANSLGDWVRVEPTGVVVVEGVYLLRPRMQQYWDASVFLDVPRPVRRSRLVARGENDPGWIDRWMRAEDYYERTYKPMDVADLVVSGWSDE